MNAPAPLRKGKQRNVELILEACIDALATTTGITGQLGTRKPENKHGIGADAELELSIEGRSYRYLVEIKHIDRMAMLHQVKARFAKANCPCMLVSPTMSAELADKCRDIGLQFMDANGNAYLQAPGMLVFVKGQRPDKGGILSEALGKGVRTGTSSALRLVFILLCAPELLNAPYRVLSETAGISLGAIGGIIQDLARRGFISDAKGSRRFLEKNRLIDEWVTTFPILLRPKLAPRRFRAMKRDWWTSVDIGQFDAAWGGEVAADQLTDYLKPEKITIYMNNAGMQQNLSKLVVQNKLRADPDGDIEILEKFWQLPPNNKAMPGSVPPLLAYADLVASMESRNLEVAAMIYQNLKNGN